MALSTTPSRQTASSNAKSVMIPRAAVPRDDGRIRRTCIAAPVPIGARLREIIAEVLAGDFDLPCVEPTTYDLWLDHRLADGTDETWLAGQPPDLPGGGL
jgi:hypothetical protein